ncbi:MAG: hypothetical protein JWM33_819 [Caulobacteraceae bacterium]|nr:hypothetical protein [Caulobacteraceae bacterium]
MTESDRDTLQTFVLTRILSAKWRPLYRNALWGRHLLRLLKANPALYNFLRHGIYGRLRSAERQSIFTRVYRENAWGDGDSVSGPGSNAETTAHIRAALPELVRELGVTSLLDIPCGDYHWMKGVELGCAYIGADLVGELIEADKKAYPGVDFRQADLLASALPAADAVFCRDCLVHLSNDDIAKALANIRRSGARFLLSTTFPDLAENQDTVTPYWRPINLALILGEPERLIRDYSDAQKNDQGKHLGVWRL